MEDDHSISTGSTGSTVSAPPPASVSGGSLRSDTITFRSRRRCWCQCQCLDRWAAKQGLFNVDDDDELVYLSEVLNRCVRACVSECRMTLY